MRRTLCLLVMLAAAVGAARAQTSVSYRLTDAVVNAGGDPRDASFLSSSSYRVRLDAIGQGVTGAGFSSASHHLNAGFAADDVPPAEVMNVRWTDTATLIWDPDKP